MEFGEDSKQGVTRKSFEADESANKQANSLRDGVADHEKDINDELTIENMFRVFDKDAGAMVDVREIMDFTEEDFKENPELLNIIKQINETNPVANVQPTTKFDESEMSMSNPQFYISHSKQMSVPIGSKLDLSLAMGRGVSQEEF